MASKTPLNRSKEKALVVWGDREHYCCTAVGFSITKKIEQNLLHSFSMKCGFFVLCKLWRYEGNIQRGFTISTDRKSFVSCIELPKWHS